MLISFPPTLEKKHHTRVRKKTKFSNPKKKAKYEQYKTNEWEENKKKKNPWEN
jgi:hypothetical protein